MVSDSAAMSASQNAEVADRAEPLAHGHEPRGAVLAGIDAAAHDLPAPQHEQHRGRDEQPQVQRLAEANRPEINQTLEHHRYPYSLYRILRTYPRFRRAAPVPAACSWLCLISFGSIGILIWNCSTFMSFGGSPGSPCMFGIGLACRRSSRVDSTLRLPAPTSSRIRTASS